VFSHIVSNILAACFGKQIKNDQYRLHHITVDQVSYEYK
jgi:hypothetical protein